MSLLRETFFQVRHVSPAMNRRGFLASTGSLAIGLTAGCLDGRRNGHSASRAQSQTTDTLTTRTAGDGIYRNPVFEHVFRIRESSTSMERSSHMAPIRSGATDVSAGSYRSSARRISSTGSTSVQHSTPNRTGNRAADSGLRISHVSTAGTCSTTRSRASAIPIQVSA